MFNPFKMFARVTPADLINQQLHDAHMALLHAEAAAEFHDAIALAMRNRIERLKDQKAELKILRLAA